ncbi:MAG: 7,8-didemethyl-8-hydroxy-5-deazariboflavin synthase subunit CofG [Candidatus Hodarchaeales archaeon]|jgi:7,8-didemethyl-8-hydroxy-5-deazariboflavin synthase CofG subunit
MSLVSEDVTDEAIELFLNNNPNAAKNLESIRTQLLLDESNFHEDYQIVSYSKNVFIPVTRLCRDYCSYCAFRLSEQKLDDKNQPYLSENQIEHSLKKAKKIGCTEVLFTLGQSPEEKYDIATKWLDRNGYNSTIDYIYNLCKLALDIGILPHSNPGVMSRSEIQKLKSVNSSMGLMLETTNEDLFKDPSGPHHHAHSKQPKQRLNTIELAGENQHPFTTGLLLGIGESKEDIVQGLETIRKLHERYGHIQEIILQPFTPHKNTLWQDYYSFKHSNLINTILLASIIVPDIPLQVPPNLGWNYSEFIQSGCRDFGGVSSVTIDYVNPENAWPNIKILSKAVKKENLLFKERLPVYPKFIKETYKNWLSKQIKQTISHFDLVDNQGFRKII